MANPNTNPNPSSSTSNPSTSTLRDAADRFTSQINKADPKQIMSDASEAMGDFYSNASQWVSENQTVVTYVGIGLVAGLLGFFLGRSGSRSMDEATHL